MFNYSSFSNSEIICGSQLFQKKLLIYKYVLLCPIIFSLSWGKT